MELVKPFCCHMECRRLAEWEIVYGASPDSFTHSCSEHLGEMLEPGVENRVYPVDREVVNGHTTKSS